MNKYHKKYKDKDFETYIKEEFKHKNPPKGIQFIIEPSEYTENITALALKEFKESKGYKQCQFFHIIYSFHLKDKADNLYGFFWL